MAVVINPAIMAAAAAQQQARDNLLAKLREARATAPTRAIALPDDQFGKPLEELVGLGQVRPMGNGRYWLDEAALVQAKQSATRAALIILIFLLSAGATLFALQL